MCSEKDRRRRRSGWDVRSCGVESEEVLLKLGKGEIVGAFPRLVGCMEFPPDGNQVVDSIGVAFGQTLLRTIDYDRGDETTLFRTVVELKRTGIETLLPDFIQQLASDDTV